MSVVRHKGTVGDSSSRSMPVPPSPRQNPGHNSLLVTCLTCLHGLTLGSGSPKSPEVPQGAEGGKKPVGWLARG